MEREVESLRRRLATATFPASTESSGEFVAVSKRKRKAGSGPSPLSSPKEVVGSHGHRPHGKSIRWPKPALYEHLRKKGMTKAKAAMISNGLWRKKHGLPPASARVLKNSPDGKDLNVPRPVKMSKKKCKSSLAKRRPNRWNQ